MTIACYKVGMGEEDTTPIHYYCKSGANLEEYEIFITKLLEKDEIRRDTLNKTGIARELNVAIWLTLNDVGRLYMDRGCRYLSNMLVKIAGKFEGFYEETGRATRLSFIPYMHVPQMVDYHQDIDGFNDYVKSFNKSALKTHTYDVDTLLLKPPKTGEAANVKIKGKAFVSANSCWRLQSATGTHLSNFKMAEIMSDIRKFLDDDFRTDSDSPSLDLEPTVIIGTEPLPKRGNRDMEDNVELQEDRPQARNSYATAAEKRPANTQSFKRNTKFARPSQRQREMQAKREEQKEEAKQAAIERSEPGQDIDPKWKVYLLRQDAN